MPTVIGMCCYVGDEVDAFTVIAKRDQAGIAHDASILLPDKAHHRQGRALAHARCPVQKAVIMAGAAHIRKVALTVIVHGRRETQLDQVRHRGEIPQHVQRSYVRMVVGLYGDRDGAH
jgi:hypothetical protein